MTNWIKAGNAAVITGGASGIGLAAARHYLSAGMRVLIADSNEEALTRAAESLTSHGELYADVCDVSDFEQVKALADTAREKLGDISCLMNNAGASLTPSAPWENLDIWKKQVEINLWGIVHGCQAFIPAMLESGVRGAVINTGSKQGITNPPGGYAYNLSKAGVKAYTESIAHALRQVEDCQLTAHLLIPGFTYTGMIARFVADKPPGAWTAEQVVEFMVESLARGDFYVLCPDNDTPRTLDEKRIQWHTDDLIQNRSALSRWDPAFADAFEAFVSETR
jgi:NAD(P)-dependent dehydrogenase (short-subunit alcohol dehydrogenase family)